MNTYFPAHKERHLSTADKIWFALLFTFIFDAVTVTHAPVRYFLLNPYSQSVLCVFLISALILNSKEWLLNLNLKISQIQFKNRNSRSGYSLFFYFFVSAVIFFELFSRFGTLIFQNLLLLIITGCILAVSIWKSIKEKNKHDLLMKTNKVYFLKHQSFQSMLIIMLPAVLSRMAALIAAAEIYNTGYNLTCAALYFLSLFLFYTSYPGTAES